MPSRKPIKVITYRGKRYFSIPAASRVLGSTVKTIRKLMDEGILLGVQLIMNQRLVIPYENVMEVAWDKEEKRIKRAGSSKDKPPPYPRKEYTSPIYYPASRSYPKPPLYTPELFKLEQRTPR